MVYYFTLDEGGGGGRVFFVFSMCRELRHHRISGYLTALPAWRHLHMYFLVAKILF